MTAYEILKINRPFISALYRAGLSADLARHIDLFEDYEGMRAEGLPMKYVEAVLSERYKLTPRAVYKIVAKFNKPVPIAEH